MPVIPVMGIASADDSGGKHAHTESGLHCAAYFVGFAVFIGFCPAPHPIGSHDRAPNHGATFAQVSQDMASCFIVVGLADTVGKVHDKRFSSIARFKRFLRQTGSFC